MYQGRFFNRESVYICGDYLDGAIYPVFQSAGQRRKKCKPTSLIQEKLNQRNREKKLTRLIHLNFTENDIVLHLTYGPGAEPMSMREVKRKLSNFLRRLKRKYKKMGLELKYISCTEQGKKSGRFHHHLILSGGLSRDEIEALWGNGYANSKRLQFTEDGVAALARYMVKDRLFFKCWNESKNLTHPEPIQHDGRLGARDLKDITESIDSGECYAWFEKQYSGFELVKARWSRNSINGRMYITFEMCRKHRVEERHHRMPWISYALGEGTGEMEGSLCFATSAV